MFLSDDAPAPYAKLVENMITGQLVGILDNTRLVDVGQQLVAAHGAHVALQMTRWNAFRCVILQGQNVLFELNIYHCSSLLSLNSKLTSVFNDMLILL